MFTHRPWNQSSQGPSHPIIQVWSSGLRQMQNSSEESPSSISSSSSSSFAFATEELRAGVTEPCFPPLGAGVLLARLEAGVPVRGKAGELATLPFSVLRFLFVGLTALAVPFLGAARFLDGACLGFADAFGVEASIGTGICDGSLAASFLRLATLFGAAGTSVIVVCCAKGPADI